MWPLQKIVWPIPLWWQSTSRDSVLVQFNSSRRMGPIPWPKKALFTGVAPVQVKLTDQENTQVKKHYFNACQWRNQNTADGRAQHEHTTFHSGLHKVYKKLGGLRACSHRQFWSSRASQVGSEAILAISINILNQEHFQPFRCVCAITSYGTLTYGKVSGCTRPCHFVDTDSYTALFDFKKFLMPDSRLTMSTSYVSMSVSMSCAASGYQKSYCKFNP